MKLTATKLPESISKQDDNWKRREWLKCQISFPYFLQNYVLIQDRNKEQTLRWEPWQYLLWLAQHLVVTKQLIVGKARQLGISWLVCAYCYWKAKFSENVKVLMLSQAEDPEAYDLIEKCIFIDDHLPEWMRAKRDPDQRGSIGFPSTGGIIRALPSTERAGRSTDATIIVCDEWEYHPYSERNFGALRPTIGGGGQFIAMSTADPMVTVDKSFFKQKFIQADSGDSGFTAIFLPWYIRPGRDQEWFERETRDMPSWQKQGEYPATKEEMLATLKTMPFFDPDALDAMYADIWNSLEHDLVGKYRGTVELYKLPRIGERYCAFTDPSDGKEDPHATVVMEVRSGEEVASSHGKITADICAQIHDDLVRLYNNAFNAFFKNASAGGTFAKTLDDLGTPNRCGFLKPDGKLDNTKNYWWEGSKALINTLLYNLEEAVRTRQIKIHRKSTLDEFKQFMRPEGEEPRAPRGGHDDWIVAWRGLWQLRKYVPMGGIKIRSFEYKESI